MGRRNRPPLTRRSRTAPKRFTKGGKHRVEVTLTDEVLAAVEETKGRKETVPVAVRRLAIERLMQATPTLESWSQEIKALLLNPPVPCEVLLDGYNSRLLLLDHEYEGDPGMAEVGDEGVIGEVSLPVVSLDN